MPAQQRAKLARSGSAASRPDGPVDTAATPADTAVERPADTAVERPAGSAPAESPPGRSLLSSIQALRALAVLLVLGYHLRPDWLPGGYIGVDVFFVISGYLMTAHLLRATDRGDSVQGAVLDFYARRIRRILPASLVVLSVVAVVTLLAASRLSWHRYFDEIRASALYYENWSLASTAADYLGGAVTSPVQHFWSLSVEEQFYLGWPILLATAGLLLGRFGRRAQLAAILVVLVGSLVISIRITASNPAVAYFTTFGRLWEFAVGALVAWFALVGRFDRTQSAALAWTGLAIIGYTLFSFTGDTKFPGYAAALPVLGAAAVLAGGDRGGRWGPQALMRARPVQYVGGISYSIYLWHLPLIVFYPIVVGRALDNAGRAAVVVAAFVLAHLTKRFIEDPLRTRAQPTASRSVRVRPLVICVALMVPPVVIASGALASVRGDERIGNRAYAQVTAHPPACYGALTLGNEVPGCTEETVQLAAVVPSPFAATDGFEDGCQQIGGRSSVRTCSFGSRSRAATRIAVAGDSHATHWLPALRTLAAARGWRVTTYLKAGCALSTSPSLTADCVSWNRAVQQELVAARYRFVLVSARSSVFQPTSSATQRRVDGLTAAWRSVQSAGSTVVAIKDVPQPLLAGRGLIPDCVYEHGAAACSFDRARAERLDIVHRAASLDRSARLVDLTSSICPGQRCRVVVGKVLVYADDSHLTATYVRSMTTAIGRALTGAGLP